MSQDYRCSSFLRSTRSWYKVTWWHLRERPPYCAPFFPPQQLHTLCLLDDCATLNFWWHEIIPRMKTHHTTSILHNLIHSCLYTVEVKGDILPHHKRPIWGNERRPIRRMNTSQIMRICLLLCTSMALTDLLRLQTRKTFSGLKSFSYGHLTSRFKLQIRFIDDFLIWIIEASEYVLSLRPVIKILKALEMSY